MTDTELKTKNIRQGGQELSHENQETDLESRSYLRTLKDELFCPFLGVLKIYLYSSNGTKKTSENCLGAFKLKHKKTFRLLFILDSMFKVFYLTVVVIVVLRGLGLVNSEFTFF